jgi:hypothetical protein
MNPQITKTAEHYANALPRGAFARIARTLDLDETTVRRVIHGRLKSPTPNTARILGEAKKIQDQHKAAFEGILSPAA